MSIKYYKKLFKEYALADLSRYREGKLGLRWRTEREVIDGKGHFVCGNKTCDARDGLHSFEVNFKYKEHGDVKNELVKVRLCRRCAKKLTHYRDKHDRHRSTPRRPASSPDTAAEPKPKREDLAEGTGVVQASAGHWAGDGPKVKTEDDEMEEYFQGLFP